MLHAVWSQLPCPGGDVPVQHNCQEGGCRGLPGGGLTVCLAKIQDASLAHQAALLLQAQHGWFFLPARLV